MIEKPKKRRASVNTQERNALLESAGTCDLGLADIYNEHHGTRLPGRLPLPLLREAVILAHEKAAKEIFKKNGRYSH